MIGCSYWLTSFILGVTLYWLTKCTNENHDVKGYSFTHYSYISSSGMKDVFFYCYLYVGMVV